MVILGHGSDLSLAPSIKPLVQRGDGGVRRALAEVARAGFEPVQLDASLSGIRPRELSRTGRRDLATTAARAGLRLAGLDLFVPRKHLLSGETVDRAVSAIVEAVGLAADLGKLPLSLTLPMDEASREVTDAVLEAADGHGVTLAIHGERDLDAAARQLDAQAQPGLGLGLDPATLILQGHDADAAAQQHGKRLTSCRLSDADRDLGQRVAVGDGNLDLTPYRVAVDLAVHRAGPVVLDLRGLHDPKAAMASAKAAWEDAAFSLGSGG